MRRVKRIILTLLLAVVILMILKLLPQESKLPARKARKLSDGASGLVVRVVDGDTLKVRVRATQQVATIRVLGIDCPESRKNSKCQRDGKQGRHGCRWQIPRGKKAKQLAKHLLENETVTLECGGKCRKGSYGRFLRYVRMKNGVDYGQEMIRKGLCEDFGWKYPHKRATTYQKVQAMAKRSHGGIWKQAL